MKNKKIIRVLKITFILIIIGISVSLMIIPEEIDYSHSLKFLNEKENEISYLIDDISRNKQITKEEEVKQKSLEQEQKDARILRDMLNENDYFVDLDIPSMLVFLEQEAVASDIEIDINFYKIVHHEIKDESREEGFDFGKKEDIFGMGNREFEHEDRYEEEILDNEDMEDMEDIEDIEDVEDINNDEIKRRNTNSEILTEENDTKKETNQNKSGEVTIVEEDTIKLIDSVFLEEVPNIKGLTVSLIPIAVKGDYSNIGDFIERLDVVDYLEPAYMGTYSTGDEIVSTIALFLFHKEGGI